MSLLLAPKKNDALSLIADPVFSMRANSIATADSSKYRAPAARNLSNEACEHVCAGHL